MESSLSSSSSTATVIDLDNLPMETSWGGREFVQWEGFWYSQSNLAAAMAARSNFIARDDDVILASSMKTGTTWLKAIIPCIINNKLSSSSSSSSSSADNDYDPFVENHPNALMPSLEVQIYRKDLPNANLSLSSMSSPRLFRTHVPYSMLSKSVKESPSKIVYITRDPKDVSVSLWYFLNANTVSTPFPFDEAFDSFCRGVHYFGPFHDHVLGYWKESLKRPEKILFLKYEHLKKDPAGQVRKLADFLGRPFADDEQVEKLLWKCSLERLKNLEINKNGADPFAEMSYKSYFRLGLVGDWKNHLSDEMKQRLDKITEMKLQGSGLDLKN